ncbi:MAG: MnhB domain-containing protein [Alphaproteobacteria bacterium]
MIDVVARILFPFTVMTGLALWARGYAAVGDGFSAGAVTGLGAALQYVALDLETARRRVAARFAPAFLAVGLLIALVVVLAPLAWGEPPVTHFPRPGRELIHLGALDLHTAALFDLGVALAVYGAITGTFDRLFPPFKGGQS